MTEQRKIIAITGGNDGIGRAIAEALVKKHRVILLGRNEEKLKRASDALQCNYIVCDVTSPASIGTAFDEINAHCKRLDALINNAGIFIEGLLTDNAFSDIERVLQTNTLGTIYCSKAALDIMIEQKSGSIINIVSQAGLNAKAERAVYTASKWAINGFTKSLQTEVARFGVRVMGIYPGRVDTSLFNKAGSANRDPKNALSPHDIAAMVDFVLSQPDHIVLPDVGIRHIDN